MGVHARVRVNTRVCVLLPRRRILLRFAADVACRLCGGSLAVVLQLRAAPAWQIRQMVYAGNWIRIGFADSC